MTEMEAALAQDREAELQRRLAAFKAEHPDLLVTHTPGSPYEVSVTGNDGQPELIREHGLEVFLDRVEAATDHDALLLDGTLYTATGGLPATLNRADDYPIDAACRICKMPIRAERPGSPWLHTGRRPGDPR